MKLVLFLFLLLTSDLCSPILAQQAPGKLVPVPTLLKAAEELYDKGAYDTAFSRCEQVLAIDPYNIAARKFEEKIGAAMVASARKEKEKRQKQNDEPIHPTYPPQHLGPAPSTAISK